MGARWFVFPWAEFVLRTLCTARSCRRYWQKLQQVPLNRAPALSSIRSRWPWRLWVLKDKPDGKYFNRRLSLREMKLIQSKCCANGRQVLSDHSLAENLQGNDLFISLESHY